MKDCNDMEPETYQFAFIKLRSNVKLAPLFVNQGNHFHYQENISLFKRRLFR